MKDPTPIKPVRAGDSPQEKVLLSTRLSSSDFLEKLERALQEIRRGIEPEATEATIAGRFERVLYATLKDIGIEFHPNKEEQVDTLRHVGRNGRLDSRIGTVIVEYKRPANFQSDRQVRAAKKQLATYLAALSAQDKSDVYGFLTDGLRCVELRASNGEIVSETSILPLNPQALFQLTRALVSLDSVALNAQNLIRDFCGANYSGVLFRAARTFYAQLDLKASGKTAMLHAEWKALFAIGHSDLSQQRRIQERRAILSRLLHRRLKSPDEEYRALFAIHTAYAIIVKLIAFRVVCDSWSQQASRFGRLLNADSGQLRIFCHGLEDGEIFRQIGILNLLEGDFFSWYADRSQWSSEIGESVAEILEVLSRYEQARELFRSAGAVDIFKDLYEAAVPQVVRGSFGEFYTPGWLAAHVLQTATGEGNAWRALDPCCGSGTFLISAIERIRNLGNNEPPDILLRNLLGRVVGIDLNPLAVLMARVNYFIHIADLLPRDVSRLVIPVFLGDASYVPRKISMGKVECLDYELATIKDPIEVVLPVSLVKNTALFVESMLKFERLIIQRNPAAAASALNRHIPRSDQTPPVLEKVRDLADRLVQLEVKGWNGIWARILTNFLTTAALGKFDVIVGNPPWIDWKNLPTSYREKIKTLCLSNGLFSGDGRTGGINLNVCALICHVAISNWLKRAGRLAFLMPKELAMQQSYEGWRRLPLNPPRFFEVFHDWSDAGNPFDPVKEDFMTFVIGPKRPRASRIPVLAYKKRDDVRSRASDWGGVQEAERNLRTDSRVACQIIPGKTIYTLAASTKEMAAFAAVAGECAYIGREGVEFFPQELLIFKPTRPGPRRGLWWFQNIQVQKSKYRVPQHEILLETEFMFPLVKGAHIDKFKLLDRSLVVPFPYRATDTQRPIPLDELSEAAPLLADFYRKFEEPIRAQTGFSDKIRGANPGEFYGLARVGPYSYRDVYVAFRDNTKWRSCVVGPSKTAWGETKRALFQNHAVSICERSDRSFIGLDEAHYICAILSTPVVENFIYSSSDQRSYKIRPPVHLPQYNPENILHRRLATLSKRAHSASISKEKIASCTTMMERAYLELCRRRA